MNDKLMVIDLDIKSKIFTVRNQQVMLDSDLAELYETEIRILNQSVKRNVGRFPAAFRFQLTTEEYRYIIRSQNVILNERQGKHRKYLPYVFVSGLVKKAKSSIVLLDNYIDETVLVLLSKRKNTSFRLFYVMGDYVLLQRG